MAVFIIGDIDPVEIKGYVEKYFSEFENSEELSIPNYKIPILKISSLSILTIKLKKQHLLYGTKTISIK